MPPIQPEKYGFKLKVVLKLKDTCIYTESIRCVTDSLKEVKQRGLKSQGQLFVHGLMEWRDNGMRTLIPVI